MNQVTTLTEFYRFASRKTVQAALRREYIGEEGTYEEFIEQLYRDIDSEIYALQASREMRQEDSEDRITIDILGGLNRHGYQATHDSKTGGHVDLSIRLGDHSWIGEAKKDGNFYEGYLQLTSRYVQASGNYAHNQGGLLLYLVKTADASGVLKGWGAKLATVDASCVQCKNNVLAFYSSHKLEGSGTNLMIRSMAVALYHRPLDKSARNSIKNKSTAVNKN